MRLMWQLVQRHSWSFQALTLEQVRMFMVLLTMALLPLRLVR